MQSGRDIMFSVLFVFFFSSRRRHTRSVSAFLLNRSSDLAQPVTTNLLIFIEARINLSRFVVTGCAAKTSATVTFPSLNLISLFAFCFNIWLNGRSEERRVGKECRSRWWRYIDHNNKYAIVDVT